MMQPVRRRSAPAIPSARFTIVHSETGRVVGRGACPPDDLAAQQAPAGCHIVRAAAPDAPDLFHVGGEFVELPPSPDEALARWRRRARAPRAAFLVALKRAGHLAAVRALMVGESEIGIKLTAITLFQRRHPDMAELRDALGVTDAEIDALFRAAHVIGKH